MSSRKKTNQIISFNKPHNRRVIPKERPKSSSSSGESDSRASDEDLLPDVFAKFDPQPHDNDSSDYGGEADEGHEEVDVEESLGDNSSMVFSKA